MGFGVERKTSIFLISVFVQCFWVPYHVDKHVCLFSISIPGALAAEVNMSPVVFACLQNVAGAFLATTISLRCFSEVGVF